MLLKAFNNEMQNASGEKYNVELKYRKLDNTNDNSKHMKLLTDLL